MQKRVFIIGGTGFLGYHAINEFLEKGWEVTSLGLPPKNPEDLQFERLKFNQLFPLKVRTILLDLDQTPDERMLDLFKGHDAIVFAAGLDDRFTPKKPAYPIFRHYNVEVPRRILELAERAGIKRAVTLGSYFAYFDRLWPNLNLKKHHPYIRSRMEQEAAVTTIPGMEGMVLELPYIFGALPLSGWKPLWEPLIKYIRSSPVLLYMKGGSACVSAVTVGRAIVAAIEQGVGGKVYPIGQVNLEWQEMLSLLAKVDGRSVKIIPLPRAIITVGLFVVHLLQKIQGKEGGLDYRHFSSLQTAKTFIDPAVSKAELGFEEGDFQKALKLTVQACGKKKTM